MNAGQYCSVACHNESMLNGCKRMFIYPFRCEVCNKIVIGRNGPQSTCSTECRMEYNRRRQKERSWRPDRLETCAECGREFTVKYPSKRRTFCGASCMGRDARRRRKVAIRSKRKTNINVIHLNDLWDRDNGRYIHCGQVVIRNGHGDIPHPFGHSIDHIQPLAFGGAHTFENTGLTHFCCNRLKAESLRKYDRSFYRSSLNDVLFSIICGENKHFQYVPPNP